MQIFDSINNYKERKFTGQFYANPGLVLCNGFFHLGLAELLKEMSSVCDSRTLVVCKHPSEYYKVEEFIDDLKPFNLDYVVFLTDLPELISYTVVNTNPKLDSPNLNFYLQIFNIFKPKHFFIGQKDFFEAKVVSELVLDFAYDMELHVVENVRNKEGILYSANLMKIEDFYLPEVCALHRSLEFLKRMIQNGQKDVAQLEKLVNEYVTTFKIFKLTNLQILDALSLNPLTYIDLDKKIFIQIEGKIENFSFVDNCLI